MANGNNSSNPLQQYGYDQQTGQALAQSLGMTTQQLAAAFATTPATSVSQPQSGSSQYGKAGPGPTMGRDLSQTVNQLQMLKAAGLTGGSGNQSGQTSLPAGAVDYSGARAAENLGAAALGAAGFSGAEGAFPVYNPVPGQINSPKGGIQTNVPSPVVANAIPNVQTPNVASVFGGQGQAAANQLYQQYGGGQGTPASVAAFYKGMTGQEVPASGVPNIAPTAGGTPTPTTPANAPGAGQPATPYATAPPAPGASAGAPAQANWAPLMGGPPAAPTQAGGPWGEIAAHTAGLESAGKAMYAHMTGNDPNAATHDDIANFHTQLTNHIGGFLSNAGTPGANYTAGVNQPPNTSPPAKMAAGGMVPGQGNRDTVPALLTPGEYVIPKQQAAQLFSGRTPIRMAEGGYVPPEVRRQRLTPPGSPPPAPGQESSGQSAGQGSSTPAAADGGQGQQGYWSNMVNQAQARQAANMGSGGPGSLDSLGTLRDEGLANQAIQGTGANTAAGVADVASGLFSGLQKAADAYKNSIKPWQDVAQAFGKQGVPNYQNVNFQQDTTV